jgi:hypothetical protein
MQGPTDKAIIATKHVMGGTMRRKNGIRTIPVPSVVAAVAAAALPPPPPSEDEDLPPAKNQGCKHLLLIPLQQMESQLIRPAIRLQIPSLPRPPYRELRLSMHLVAIGMEKKIQS